MWVTCYVDASFSRGQGGAWGVWLRSARGRVVRHGLCPDYVRDSTAAELAAVYAGVYLAQRTWPETRGVLVCSDCQAALQWAQPGGPHARRGARRVQEKLHALVSDLDIAIQCKWVKGHQPARSSTAAYLNHHCDRMAVRARRQKVEATRTEARRKRGQK